MAPPQVRRSARLDQCPKSQDNPVKQPKKKLGFKPKQPKKSKKAKQFKKGKNYIKFEFKYKYVLFFSRCSKTKPN